MGRRHGRSNGSADEDRRVPQDSRLGGCAAVDAFRSTWCGGVWGATHCRTHAGTPARIRFRLHPLQRDIARLAEVVVLGARGHGPKPHMAVGAVGTCGRNGGATVPRGSPSSASTVESAERWPTGQFKVCRG